MRSSLAPSGSLAALAALGLAALAACASGGVTSHGGSTTPPPGSTAPALASVSPASGPVAGGTAVILGGTGFASGATVSFGDAAATVSSVAATEIHAVAPAHAAGAVDVKVSNPDGQSSTRAGAFTYQSSPPPGPCQVLAVQSGVTADGYLSDRYTWSDAGCQARSALLARAGFLRTFAYQADGSTRTCGGANQGSWPGWGFVVDHYGSSAATSLGTSATPRTVFAGRHHAVHEFLLTVSPGGAVDVTIHWVFATGRSNPVYAITLAPRVTGLVADTRAPYGNLNFDGDASGNGNVAGIGWGDRYRFRTQGAGPVSFQSDWDYTQANAIPHVLMWASGADAEMGAVQTQSFAEHQGGGDYGGGILADCWQHTSASPGSCLLQASSKMPQDWLWPFQLNQYELPFTTASHRLAWGMTYGAVGSGGVSSFGQTISGYPYQSYAVFVVLGKHSALPVEAQVAEVEARLATTASATTGSVVTSGPGGVGRNDTVTWPQAGLDPAYGTWTFRAAGNALAAHLAVGAGHSLPSPVLRVLDWTGGSPPAVVSLGGQDLTADVDYFASVDAASNVLWLTLARTLQGGVDLAVH